MKQNILIIVILIISLYSFGQQINTQYIYNDINRVIQVTYPNGAIIQYKYDKLGNREEHKITGNASLPDLTIVNQLASPASVGQGGTLNLSYLLQNAGQLAAGVNKTKIYLNASPVITGATLLDSILHNGIASGGINVSKSVSIPILTSTGSKYFLLVADANGQVTESNENNNIANIAITVTSCAGITATTGNIVNATCNLSNGSVTVTPSGGSSYTYLWNSIPSQTNATATNLSGGSYTVTVTAQNGCSTTAAASIINTGLPPLANYIFTSPSQNVVQFNNTSTNTPTSYTWNFGDGFTSTLTSPSHTYSQTGTYNVCLTANNGCGSDVKCQNVQVSNGCLIPYDLNASNISTDSVNLFWSGQADSFRLEYKALTSTSWISHNNIFVNFQTLKNLQAGTAYHYRVKAFCGNIGSSFSDPVIFYTQSNSFGYGFLKKLDFPTDLQSVRNHCVKTSDGFIVTAVSEAISRNVYLVKFDQNGNKIWNKILNVDATTTNQQGLTDLTALSNGGVAYVVRSGTKRYLAKVDANGNTNWIKELTIGSASNFFIINTDAGLNDEVLISGWCRLGNSTTPLMGFIYRISASGSIIWKRAYEIPGSEVWIYSVKPISGGNFTFTGFVRNISTTHSDVLYARINANGDVQTSVGIYTAIDRFESFDHVTLENAGANNGSYLNCGLYGGLQNVLLKYVEGTGVEWANSYGTYIPSGLNVDGSANLYFNSSSGEVIKTKPNGDFVWSKKFINSTYNLFTRKLAVLNNNIFISGGSGVDQYLIKADTSGSAPQCITTTIASGEAVLPLTVSSVSMTSVDVTPFTYTDITVASQNAGPAIFDECPCTTQANFTANAQTFCTSDSIMFISSSTNAITFKWYLNALNTTPVSTSNMFKYAFNSSGSYTVFLIAENGYCKDTFQNAIVINPKPVITVQTVANPTCSTSINGSISINVAGATSPYQYIWSNGATTQNIANLPVGTYLVTVTDFKGCLSTMSTTLIPSTSAPTLSVTIPANVTISNIVYQNPNCNGSNVCTWYYNAVSTNAATCSTTNLSTNPNGTFSNIACNGGLIPINTSPGVYYFKYKASNACGEALYESSVTVLSCKKYLDADGDGFGHQSTYILDCAGTPAGYVSNNLDCNDNCSNCFPGSGEDCDGLDNNCNGLIDEGCLCMPPGSISVTGITPTSATVNWTIVGNAQNYTLSYRTVNTAVWQQIAGITSNSQVLNGLSANTSYELMISSGCGATNSYLSDTIYFTTLELCSPPVGLMAEPLTNSVAVTWMPNPYALSYIIDYKMESQSTWTSFSTNHLGNAASITGLKGGTNYNVRIKCNCANSMQSSFSSIDFLTTVLSTNNVILTDSTLFGISRAELYNNEVHVMAATHPQLNSVPGYPDPNTWYRTKLISESNSNLLPLEVLSVSTDMTHHNLRVNNANQLAIVYQSPTGSGYGFRMPYKVWNGTNLVVNENVFPNSNNGAIPVLEFNTTNVPTIVSFSHAGYSLLSYKKPAASWTMTPVTSNGTYYSSTRSINKQDSMIVIDRNHSTGTLHIHKNHMINTTWIAVNSGIQVDFNCDLELSNTGGLAMLYNKNNVLIANINGIPENVTALNGIDHRADLIYDGNNSIYVAYQTTNKVAVLKKVGGTWNEVFSHDVSISTAKANLTKITLVKKPTGISVVYADNFNVYVSLINTIMVGIDETNKITLKYYAEVNASTVNNQSIKVYGSHTGLKSCSFNVVNDVVTITANPSFRAGEQIHVSTLPSVLSSGGQALNQNTWLLTAKSTNLTNGHFVPISSGITLPTNATAYSFDCSMADMNKDGKMDIIYRYHASYGAATNVLVYLQNASGLFSSPLSYSTPNSHSSIIGTPDLNGDGFPDLVLNFNVPSTIQVWLNNGSGGLFTPSSYVVTSFSNGAKIFDADNDGDLDIMSFSGVSNINANALSLIKNNGNGTFSAQTVTNTSAFGSSLVPMDVDLDGDLDILFTSNNAFSSPQSYRIYKNNGQGVFSLFYTETNTSNKTISSATDINNNQLIDILINAPSTQIIESKIDSTLKLSGPTMNILSNTSYAFPYDVDGDQDIDVFIPNYDNAGNYTTPLKLAFNDGSGVYTLITDNGLVQPAISFLGMYDYDSDGDVDHLYREGQLIKVALNDCHLIRELENIDSPLSGIYRAALEIKITGNNVNVLNNTNVTFDSPIVKIPGFLKGNLLSNIVVRKGDCDF